MAETKKSRPWVAFLPIVIFLGCAGMFYSLLSTEGRDVSALPSALLDKPAPNLTLEPLAGIDLPGVSPEMLTGKLSIVNVFASWCGPCRDEHPYIIALSEQPNVQMIGLNYKDRPTQAVSFLNGLGNPYDAIGVDPGGRAAIEWGVYGIPETFIVNAQGKIIFKHVGPISEQTFTTKFLPIINAQLNS